MLTVLTHSTMEKAIDCSNQQQYWQLQGGNIHSADNNRE